MAGVLKWMFVLVLLMAVAGGGAVYWMYTRSDEEVRQFVLQQLATMAPTLKFDIARAHGELNGRVSLYGLTIRLPDDSADQPSIEVEQTVIMLDSELMDLENVSIQKLRIIKPKVRATRGVDQTWNLQKLAFQPTTTGVLPDVEIEQGTILVEVQLPGKSSRRMKFENFEFSAIPKDARKLAIQVGAVLNQSGPLMLEADVNLDGPTWECVTPESWHVPVDSKLFQLLSDLSPKIQENLEKAGLKMQQVRDLQLVSDGPQARDVNGKKVQSSLQAGQTIPDFGLSCVCGLKFHVSQKVPGSDIAYAALVSIESGKVDNDLLPFTLHDLHGKIEVNNQSIKVEKLQATNGPVQIEFNGHVDPDLPIGGSLTVLGIEIDSELKARLPEVLHRKIDELGLTGICDIDARFTQAGSDWERSVDVHLVRGTVTEKRFPVTVRNVVGDLRLVKNAREDFVTFKARGMYSKRPVNVVGKILNPGPQHEGHIQLSADDLPLDRELVDACPAPVSKTIDALKLNCRHDLRLTLQTTGPGQRYVPDLTETIRQGTLSFHGFPYDIQQFEGTVTWKGTDVEFKSLRGIHDSATLTGSGVFLRGPAPGRLELSINARNAAFEESLRLALPRSLGEIWSDFRPKGFFDIETLISWIPNQPCEVRIPSVKVKDGTVLMKSFPWPLQNLSGEFAFNENPDSGPGKLVIKDVSARHDDTLLRATGIGHFRPDRPWRLEFDQVYVDDLVPNATLRNALPEAIQRVFDTLRPEGKYSFSGPVSFFGPPKNDKSIGAAWNLKILLSECQLTAGRRIEDLWGEVQLRGEWSGKDAWLIGRLKLDTLSVFRQASGPAFHVTTVTGPFELRNGRFAAGADVALRDQKANLIPPERIRGTAFGGVVYLDAEAMLSSQTEYSIRLELENGELEQLARQWNSNPRQRTNLAGKMNGWTNLKGIGSNPDSIKGDGYLRIAPAALYELPLIVQMFSLPQLRGRGNDATAFEVAELKFAITDGRFNFNSIELLGDAVSLLGRGYVRFDGAMNLDFGWRPGRGRQGLFQGPLMKAEWLAIRVTGRVGDPQTVTIPVPQIDDAFRQFLGAFTPPPNPRFAPRASQPRMSPPQ